METKVINNCILAKIILESKEFQEDKSINIKSIKKGHRGDNSTAFVFFYSKELQIICDEFYSNFVY